MQAKSNLERANPRRLMHPTAVMALGFALVVLLGAGLLMLPVSSRSGQATAFLPALFTATSATCVTGLVVLDTATHWSAFGRVVLIVLIQIGGLGFMTMASLASFISRRRITLRERMVMGTGLGLAENSGIVRLTKRVLVGTMIFEGTGALILWLRFWPVYGPRRGLTMGIFHAVSAFCNAGFDLMGTEGAPFVSMVGWQSDVVVNLTLMALIVIGGLGFFVWSDIWDRRGLKRLHLHTKLVLTATVILLLLGFGLTLLFEWNNPATLGNLSFGDKLLAAAFQSVTWRTAGFNTIDQAALTGSSQALGILLMLIGGSPGSTAGGIKTVTFVVLLLTAVSALRGKTTVSAFHRTISPRSIMNAVTLMMVGGGFTLGGACLMSYLEGAAYRLCAYEVASAFGTVGLSMGLTPTLGTASRILLILLMYFGRVGVLTLGIAVLMRRRDTAKISYPEGEVMVG